MDETDEQTHSHDPRVPLGHMGQAWTDIRNYSAQMWQIAAVCLSIIFLGLNLYGNSITSNYSLPDWLIVTMESIALIFSGLTLYTLLWLRSNIITRQEFIKDAEGALLDIMGDELVIPMMRVFSKGIGPLQALIYVFSGITFIIGFIFALTLTILAFTYIIFVQIFISIILLLVSFIIVSIFVAYNISRTYSWLRTKEKEFSFENIEDFLSERIKHTKLKIFAERNGFSVEIPESSDFEDGPEAWLLVNNRKIPVFYSIRLFLDGKGPYLNTQWFDYMESGSIAILIHVESRIYKSERVPGECSYIVIGYRQDYKEIKKFINNLINTN